MLVSTRVYNPPKSVGDYKIVVAFHPSLLYNNSIVIEKGFQMSFESSVLSVVSNEMDTNAEFFNGTLFVECTPREAVRLETILLETLDCGIILSRVDNEAVFDFV